MTSNLVESLKLAPPVELPFPLTEYVRRRKIVQAKMREANIDLIYVSSPEAMNWLTGDQAEWYQAQSSSHWPPLSGIALHVEHEELIAFDTQDHVPRYAYTSIITDVRWLPEDGNVEMELFDHILSELRHEGWLRGTHVGLELGNYRPNPRVSQQFQKGLLQSGASAIVDATDLLRKAKLLKSTLEREMVRTAHRIANIGMQAAEEAMRPGITELEVYGSMVSAMASAGGETAGIILPVLSGLKTLSGHAVASRKIMMPGETVIVDICGVYNRYHANVGRTFCLGTPDPEVENQVAKASAAFAIAAEIARPDMLVNDFVAELEKHYRSEGIWEDRWYYGGYEIGIGFPPDWVGEWLWECGVDNGDKTLEAGLVINMESNTALPRRAGRGMLIDTIIVEEDRVDVLGAPSGGPIVIEKN